MSVAARAPILVTGIPRSGTSWVGKVLESSGEVVYINEPLNTNRPPRFRPGLLRAHVPFRFQYISTANEHEFLPAFRDMFALRFHPLAELRANHDLYGLLRLLKYWSDFELGRVRRRRPLLDEPLAVFSLEWFRSRFGCPAVVLVRHPAAIVNSRKKLGHLADFSQLLRQPLLMQDFLAPFERELEQMQRRPDDVVGNGCLLWKVVYSVVAQLRERVPGIRVVRHEDLSREPIREFAQLHAHLGVPFGDRTRRFVEASTSAPADKPGGTLEQRRRRAHSWSVSRRGISRTGFRPLDSRSYAVRWKRELAPEEIRRVRALTADVAAAFYGEEDW